MRLKTAYFFAILFNALALVPAGAHLFALPNKIGLPQEQYFVAQGVYRGWALFGIVIVAALLANLALVVMLRRRRAPFLWALIALLAIVGTQIIFWTWTYPANQATANWTQVPDNWRALRDQWEYAHAAGAVLNLIALAAAVLSLLTAARWTSDQPRSID
jgi:ABC-type branched-subunit amino acid transport system permease subunit